MQEKNELVVVIEMNVVRVFSMKFQVLSRANLIGFYSYYFHFFHIF